MPIPEIHRTEVAGIRAFMAAAPGPFTAMLLVRAGRCDETLPTCGVTHLVEHLAMPATSRHTIEFQASVDNVLTTFAASGDPTKVGAFLTETTEELRSLPRERFESEQRILLAEEAAAPYNLVRLAYALRFGPTGHGLTGYDEWGLRRLTADDVQAWSDERFVRGNAALWITGEPPDSLQPLLPDGPAWLPPDTSDLDDLRLPALSREGVDGAILLSLVSERTHAFKLALGVLEHRLRDQLRYRLGITYGVDVVFMPLTASTVHVAIIADAAGESAVRAVQEAREVIGELAANGPTPEELEHEWTAAREQAENPHELPSGLYYEAAQLLLGAPFQPEAARLAEREAVTAGEVAAAAAAAAETLLVLAPNDTPDLEGLAPYPLGSSTHVEGRRHRLRGNPLRRDARDVSLTVGDDGLTLAVANLHERTVLYRTAALVRRNDDGSRTLVSHDGFFVTVDPRDWRGAKDLVASIDASVDPAIVVAETPDLDRRRIQVEELVATLSSRRLIGTEIAALPTLLDDDEQPLVFAKGSKGWLLGLIVLTDRRLLFVYNDELKLDVPLEQIRNATSPGDRSGDLVLDTDEDSIKLTEIQPLGRAKELADGIAGAAAARRSA